jgi:hypothetical protein
MQSHRRLLAAIASMMLAAIGSSFGADAPPATQFGATQPAAPVKPPPEVQKAVDDLIASKALRLSSDAGSSPDSFCFRFALRKPADAKLTEAELFVGCSKGKLAILVSTNQLPIAYLTDGWMVMIDPDDHGRLIVHEGGGASFNLGFTPEGLNGDFHYNSKEKGKSRILVDPAPILQSLMGRLALAEYDEKTRSSGARWAAEAGALSGRSARYRSAQWFGVDPDAHPAAAATGEVPCGHGGRCEETGDSGPPDR